MPKRVLYDATRLTGVGGTAKAKPYGMDGDYSIKIQREGQDG
jgi:hypothetical protein